MSSKHRVVVLKIIAGQCSVAEAAVEYGMSRQYLHKLVARYREVLATNTIDPTRTYWRNNEKEPGRWPGSPS